MVSVNPTIGRISWSCTDDTVDEIAPCIMPQSLLWVHFPSPRTPRPLVGTRSIIVARMANLEAGGPRLGDRQVVMESGGERSDVASVARGRVLGTDVGFMVRHVAAK